MGTNAEFRPWLHYASVTTLAGLKTADYFPPVAAATWLAPSSRPEIFNS